MAFMEDFTEKSHLTHSKKRANITVDQMIVTKMSLDFSTKIP